MPTAYLEDPIQILTVSDDGLVLSMPFEVAVGAKIKISSGLFKDIGLPSPYLKVIRVAPDSEAREQFRVEAAFMADADILVRRLRERLSRL